MEAQIPVLLNNAVAAVVADVTIVICLTMRGTPNNESGPFYRMAGKLDVDSCWILHCLRTSGSIGVQTRGCR